MVTNFQYEKASKYVNAIYTKDYRDPHSPSTLGLVETHFFG